MWEPNFVRYVPLAGVLSVLVCFSLPDFLLLFLPRLVVFARNLFAWRVLVFASFVAIVLARARRGAWRVIRRGSVWNSTLLGARVEIQFYSVLVFACCVRCVRGRIVFLHLLCAKCSCGFYACVACCRLILENTGRIDNSNPESRRMAPIRSAR